jgi:NDP-sugar pyrophosphorylase family protein
MGALAFLDSLDDDFLVMNGDICTNLNFSHLFDAHKQSGCLLTVGSFLRKERLDLGILELDFMRQRIVGFKEKPIQELFVSMGVYGLNRRALSFIPRGEYFGFDNLMHSILTADEPIHSYMFSGRWYDIGRLDDYVMVQEVFEKEGTALFGL